MPEPYDGPAVVEFTSAHGLVLYLKSRDTLNATGAGMGIPSSRVGVSATNPPPLARGANVWLHRGSLGDAIRDREGGTLIAGSLGTWLPNTETEPLKLGSAQAICTRPESDNCVINAHRTYYEVTVNGDVPVVVPHQQHATLALNGLEYDLWMHAAARESDEGSTHRCADSGEYDHRIRIDADILPLNPDAAVANVTNGGELPDCAVGDVPPIPIAITVSGDPPNSTPLDGAIRYIGKTGDEMRFEFVDRDITVRLAADAGVFPEPTPGDLLWLTTPGGTVFALRRAQGGDLLLLRATSADLPSARDAVPELEPLLGISVASSSRCFTPGVEPMFGGLQLAELHDLLFGTTPPVRVRSGTSERINLAGKPYEVRATALGRGLDLTILPAP